MGDQKVWSNLQGTHFEEKFYKETFKQIKNIIFYKPKKNIFRIQTFLQIMI